MRPVRWSLVAVLAACASGPDSDGASGGHEDTCDVARGTLHAQVLPAGDGLEDRTYWLHVPASYDCSSAPLLIDFHGTASDVPEEAYGTDALIAMSEATGAIVARPRS